MNIEFTEINDYLENKEENIFIKAYWYSLIVGVLLILVVLIASFYKKNLYYENILLMESNEFVLTISYEDIGLIINNNQIIIGNDSYNYYVREVNILDSSNLTYQIRIFINGYSNYQSNIFYNYKILLRKETILEYLVRVLKGE